MRLKDCPCCKKPQTTKNSTYIGRAELGVQILMFNCNSCGSTFSFMNKKDKEDLNKQIALRSQASAMYVRKGA